MAQKKSMFPYRISEQVADLNTKLAYITDNAGRFRISVPELELLTTRVNAVNAAHSAASNKDTRSKLDVAARVELIKLAQEDMRRIINYYINNSPQATEVDYEALRIPRSGHHTPLPAPDSVPRIGHISSADLAVTVPFSDARHNKRAKPEGVYGIEAFYQLGGTPPTSVTTMTEHTTETASPLRIKFTFDDEFKIVYLAFRWVGTRGDYGPWSGIYKIGISR
ncbi:MAG: hypothetical protein LBD27_05600 [Tannerella sp.]|jgi:hypothetical protein|nr:hypothetical protein [Tannerella sp.]